VIKLSPDREAIPSGQETKVRVGTMLWLCSARVKFSIVINVFDARHNLGAHAQLRDQKAFARPRFRVHPVGAVECMQLWFQGQESSKPNASEEHIQAVLTWITHPIMLIKYLSAITA
jgi:hypothetical protein